MNANSSAIGRGNRRLEHFHVQKFIVFLWMEFDVMKRQTRLQYPAIVTLVLFRQLFIEQLFVPFTQQFLTSASVGLATFVIDENQPAFAILAKNIDG